MPWITAGRLALLGLLAAFVLSWPSAAPGTGTFVAGLYGLGVAALAASALFFAWAAWRRYIRALVWTQVVSDVVLVTLLVLWTGRAESPLTFLYPVAIITACLLGGRAGGTTSAVLSTITFALLYWPPRPGPGLPERAFTFFLNMAAFNLTAALGIALAQRLRSAQQELSEARVDLRRMEQIQRHLARNLRSGVVTVDDAGRLTSFNQAAVDILGPGLYEAYGHPLETAWPEGARLLAEVAPEVAAGGQHRYEIRQATPAGERCLGVAAFPLSDEADRPLGHGLIFQDITELKNRQRHLEYMNRLAALGEMAAGLAHEIRNPLASLSGSVQFLSESGGIPDEARRLLDIVGRECERLDRLVESFLLFARPERKEGQPVSLREEVERTLALLARRPELPRAELTVSVPDGSCLHMDPGELRQILFNVILNAYQALPPEGGRISISVAHEADRHVLTVSDNGAGIRREDLPHIFDPFFTTVPERSGLGLSVVQRLVLDAGGEVEARSEPGRGTTFVVRMPARPCPPKGPGAPGPIDAAPAG
ncbi:PAS domain-containing protein [Dissulfurirhabdus thermomarina]|uniref:two-component system sensor histidine kinase NtrB n=1 Tax=Dissulfurirhabdus thermomarina TaxID=1765737 RepID=UPI00147003BF|nr:ATP-binding protein [Dissulfurirhabdus thermomarina]NMX22440.1 PAS domain-containing protein [Dissulfurirhabdus thermomarina]